MMQATIYDEVVCRGIGVHFGRNVQLKLKPAPINTGIVFIRTDIFDVNNRIEALYSNVVDTSFSTTIANESGVRVATIEHLMAALFSCGLDNVYIEINSPEVPIMDGSSRSFVFMIEYVGIKFLEASKKILRLTKEFSVNIEDSTICAYPSDNMIIDLTIDFKNPIIGKQKLVLNDMYQLKNDIMYSRTFGFVKDFTYLRNMGLAQGSSLENTIAIADNSVLNYDRLRYHDEFVRHKLLDLLGDLNTIGCTLICSITGYKTSHAINHQFLKLLLADFSLYEIS
ncbi:UDP-3-O-acyl-N-acetylglucosamine deacetylase [Rickettsia endosymbiont of Cardiosporidium cionae]|uniref:UDP-3-O-acyl-N-acetylglucosamine deacetylase n=1 Tax=Rickettsia endosymbiont of Cardiosporidium cionae TaxID=2777155 RepID=UPI0018950409|nr:UDP-3-O-acyl-N-acetylglucosamine deacetylase [Rickettsia endosymbiont of Cardiosporidium cionae]